MSLPYFPMYPSDFEAKTSHLTLAEDGAYNRLLRITWMTSGCTIPDDDAWIARRLRCDKDTFDKVVRVVIDEFFDSGNGRLSNAKLSEIYAAANEAHQKRVSAGSRGGKAKALRSIDKAPSKAKAMPYQPEPEPELYKRDTKVSPKKRASRLPDDWFLPKQYGEWAIEKGYDYDQVKLEAEKFKDYWAGVGGQKGTKLDWLATWRNWMRNSKQLTGGENGKRNHNSGNRPSGASGAHASLIAGFAANAERFRREDDGLGDEAQPSSAPRLVAGGDG